MSKTFERALMLNPNLVTRMSSGTNTMLIKATLSFITVIIVLLIGGSICRSEEICGLSVNRIETYKANIKDNAEMIKSTLKRFNVDEKFIWLAMIESGGKPDNESHKGALGLWQLTAATARHYGCEDRTDPKSSTEAAAKYLAKLSRDFNGETWKVIVGYNMGGSNFRRAGKPTKEAAALANTVTCLMRRNYELW